MESYSVEAVLIAVDKNFTSTMNKADSSMGTLDKNSQNTNTSILDIAKGVGVFKLVDSAIGVVKSSLDGAINRFDTLNAYPKVMAQMGYSTDDVAKSTELLKKGVDGLPTSLQELTKSSQSFAILEKSATSGAKTATALNDAFLASGASAADASRGVQQYSQMLSSGKVDLMSWRTLQETMPYALTQVAKSFGLTGKSAERDLYAKLKSGDITMEQLNKRFVELDGGANGFAKTARTASGGIGTSFTNMRNAVVNGMANTVETINNALKDAGLKNGISTLFDEGKQAIIKGFAVFNQIVATAIPKIVGAFKTLFDFVNQNKDWIGPLVAGITAGVAAYKLWKGAITAWNTVTKIATAVQVAFNAVMDANPIMLIVIAIAAIVAGLVYFFTQTKTGQKIWSNFVKFLGSAWQSLVKISKDVWDNITKAWDSAVKWFSDTWNNIKNGAKGLWDGTIQGVKDAVDSVKNAWNGIKEWFANLWKGTTSGLASAWDSVTTTLAPFVETIKIIFQPILDFFSGLWGQVKTIFGSAWEIIKTVVMGPVLLLIDLITGDFNQFKEDFAMLWKTLFTNIQTLVSTFVKIVVGFFTAWGRTVSNIWSTVVNTVKSLWGTFTTWVINMAKSIVDGIVKGWNSFKQGTIDLWNATIQWVKDTWASFKQWVVDSANAIVNGVKQGWKNLKQGTIDLWNGMINGLKGIWDGLKQSVGDLIDNVKTTFNNLKNINLLDIGKAIIDGLVKGLKKKWEDGMKFISGIGDWIRKHKGPIRKDRKLLIPAGKVIMTGLNSGLTGGFRNVQSNVSGMGDMIANAINSDYSVDIGANVAAANRSISSQVSHDVNLNQGKQPAYVTLKLGSQEYKAFVEDISGVQGWQNIMMNKF
ncbi:tape measure protein [Lactococcus cremoris]|uniref:phage tail protein n=1 Tax=Lactococcus lactis subsp. cremoris TaxID=1359 RepID=UPI00287F83CD|nr:tape measure protein [Lactococcus cremoris]WMB98912.1 tape measure protein [Lactococcus cremoris]